MKSAEKVKIQLPSGCNVDMSLAIHDNYYINFSESQLINFGNFINAGLYFPQIVQFVTVMIAISNGKTDIMSIILCNLISGILYTLIWFWGRFYKIPGLAFISALVGSIIFRLFLHFIIIAAIAFFVFKDWTILLSCIIGGIITSIVKSILFASLSSVKYHNEVVKYVYDLKL